MDVRGWVRPVTGLGWAVLGAGVVSWVVAARFDWVEFGYIAAACLLALVLAVLFAIGRAVLKVTVEVDPDRVVVGTPAAGRVGVRNVSRRRLLPLALELPIGAGVARFNLPSLGPGTEHEELFVVGTQRRGVIEIGPATTVRGDPVGLLRREVTWTDVTELIVHPRTVQLETFGAGLLSDLEGQQSRDLSMSDLNFNALREYTPGDDRRYIHWRSSARIGRFMVRQFLETRRSHLAVCVDSITASYADAEDYELAISVGGSLGLRSVRDEHETTVLAGRQVVAGTGSGQLILDALARAELGTLGLPELARRAAQVAPNTSTAVLVTGANVPITDIQRAAQHLPLAANRIAVVAAPHLAAGLSNVGSLSILTITKLAQLPHLLHTAMATR